MEFHIAFSKEKSLSFGTIWLFLKLDDLFFVDMDSYF